MKRILSGLASLTDPPVGTGESSLKAVSSETTDWTDVEKVVATIESTFNPFGNVPKHLSYINNGQPVVKRDEISRSIRTMEAEGQKLHHTFVLERLEMCKVDLTFKLTKRDMLLPSSTMKDANAIPCLSPKEDQKLVQNLKVVVAYRKNEIIKALEYEPKNVPTPVSANDGKAYQAPKSIILPQLKALSEPPALDTAAGTSSSVTELSSTLPELSSVPESSPTLPQPSVLDAASEMSQLVADLSMIVNLMQYKQETAKVSRNVAIRCETKS